MLHKPKKVIAVICVLALIITLLPVSANAAAKPKFVKTYKSLYENGGKNGVYTYKIKNLTKGQTVKWSLSGTGKSYAKLKKKTTKASSTTVSNTLTIDTDGKIAAKNKLVKVTAKVYSKSGKLVCTLSAGNGKIKAKPTGIEIQSGSLSDKTLLVGESYQFNYKISPANATSTNTWSVTDENNNDLSSYITKAGVFTPQTEGTFTITVRASIGDKLYASASEEVTVGTTLLNVRQLAANKIVAVYSGDARNLVSKDIFSITSANNADILIKDASFSADGTEVTLTTYSTFKDSAVYTLSDNVMCYDFTTYVGAPVSMKLLTTEAMVNKPTAIEYGIYDINGIEVSAAYPGTITYEQPQIMNGQLIPEKNQILMTNIGDTGTFTMVYTNQNATLTLRVVGQIRCTAATTSSDIHFTLTTSDKTPDYNASSYKDNHQVASGSNYYIHFRALDTDGGVIPYDSITYESSDPDTLLINNSTNGIAKVTAIKNGVVKIIATATYGKQTYAYQCEVTVTDPAALATISLDKNVVTMSNRTAYGYEEYIKVKALDQYGESFALTDESAQITNLNTTTTTLATYDAAANRIRIDASGSANGTYHYTLTVTVGSHKATANFTVIVQTPPANGTSSYRIVIDNPTLDLALTSDTDLNDVGNTKNMTIRLAEYKDDIFNQYIYIYSAKITKNGLSYTTDLTTAGSYSNVDAGSGNQLTLSTIRLDNDVCTKASTGEYNVELKFYPSNGTSTSLATVTGSFTLTDSQAAPEITIHRTTANTPCKNALELAKNCLNISGVSNAEITDCVITGSDKSGSDYTLGAGESVNIKSVTVQVKTTIRGGKTIISTYTVAVGKTLKNA